jgi:hypothetical protein
MAPATRSGDLPVLPPNPEAAGRALLELHPSQASEIFQSLDTPRQLRIVDAVEDPYDREEIYYLVPDCTDLIRRSRVEPILEIISTVFGTGLACGILSAVSPEQFAEMFERTAVQAGLVDREVAMLWVAELLELEPDELGDLLGELDPELLSDLFRGRVDVPERFRGLAIDSGMIELEHVDFGDDEEARMMAELIWSGSPELFIAMIRYLLTEKTKPRVEEGEPDDDEALPAGGDPPRPAAPTLDLTNIDALLPPARPKHRTSTA